MLTQQKHGNGAWIAAEQDHTIAYVCTVDSDAVVLTIHYFHTFGLSELWVAFGCGKYYHNISVHAICSTKSLALPRFHTFFGCGKEDSLGQLAKPHRHTDLTHSVSSPLHSRV